MASSSNLRTWRRRQRSSPLRRRPVGVPHDPPSTDAIFLVLRRMRAPLLLLLAVFTVAVAGLTFIEGRDADGHPYRMTVFESFYFMSYTAATIGYGEVPYPFTTAQRLWVTVMVYATVLGWAYAFGSLFALFQDAGFRAAVAAQRFRSKIRRIREPFVIVAGFGDTGVAIARELDDLGRRVVVLDDDASRVETTQLLDHQGVDVPSLDGDVRNPVTLGMAGLSRPQCEAVVAVTGSDEANLAVVMAVQLLAPEVPVIARSDTRVMADRMRDFGAVEVINAYDLYGAYLTLAWQQPATHQLAMWLMSPGGAPLPERVATRPAGAWVVAGNDQFGAEIAKDLVRAGLPVRHVSPDDGDPDLADAAGFVAGTDDDVLNIALAARARRTNPDVYVSVRQGSRMSQAPLAAMAPDSVFTPSAVVAREVLARMVNPAYWDFVMYVLAQDHAWSEDVLARLQQVVGPRSGEPARLRLTDDEAPALVQHLRRGGTVRLGDLLRHPQARDRSLAVVPLVLVRGDEERMLPDDTVALAPGDELILVGRELDLDVLTATGWSEAEVTYVATGQVVPSTWVWRRVRHRRGHRQA